ncbi:MAG: hypothetical protein ACREBU_22725, partial [Nitrososphaera sp.]
RRDRERENSLGLFLVTGNRDGDAVSARPLTFEDTKSAKLRAFRKGMTKDPWNGPKKLGTGQK